MTTSLESSPAAPVSAPGARLGPAHAALPLDLALTIVGSVVSAKVGGNAMAWHFRLGYVVFALLLFRLLWGFLGGLVALCQLLLQPGHDVALPAWPVAAW
jgi:hypothetical protein